MAVFDRKCTHKLVYLILEDRKGGVLFFLLGYETSNRSFRHSDDWVNAESEMNARRSEKMHLYSICLTTYT